MRTLGTTGIQVSELALGAMNFGAWGNPDHDDCIRIIDRALEAGINFIDTADLYAAGESEEILGKALKGRRDNVVLSTKLGNPVGDDPNQAGGSRRWITTEIEAQLRRLQTDHVDLLLMHRPDYRTGLDETLGALSDLVRAGKVRAIGSSNYPPAMVVEAQWVAEKRLTERFTVEQPPYSLLQRGIERELLPTTQKYGMGTMVWSPLSNGWLSGRYRKNTDLPSTHRDTWVPSSHSDMTKPSNQRKLEAADALGALADEAGVSLIHLALAFVLRHPGVTSVLTGPRTLQHLEGQLGAVDYTITDDVLDRIDQIVTPGLDIVPDETYSAPDPLFGDPAARRR